jgi:YggT family protein
MACSETGKWLVSAIEFTALGRKSLRVSLSYFGRASSFGRRAAFFRIMPSAQRRSMRALFEVIDIALSLYMWIVIIMAIFSWLIAFNVVNTRNPAVAMIGDFLYRITEPALRPIRNFLPSLGGIDISPVILFLIIIFIQRVIELYILPNVF